MKTTRGIRTVVPPTKREIEQFASWFHQDWQLHGQTFEQSAATYIRTLSRARRMALLADLKAFEWSDASPKTQKAAWHRLGAETWSSTFNTQVAIRIVEASLPGAQSRAMSSSEDDA